MKAGWPSGRSRDSPASGRGTTTQLSLRIVPSAAITSGIYPLLEWLQTNPAIGIQEGFFFGPFFYKDVDHLGYNVGHLVGRKRRAENFSDGGIVLGGSAKADLVELSPFFVNAQNTDVAHVVVTTGVHATGNVQVDRSEERRVGKDGRSRWSQGRGE